MATNIKRLKRVVRTTPSTGLTLTAANKDYLSIPDAELNTDVPTIAQQSVWAFGGRFTVPTVNPSLIYGLFGKTIASGVTDRYGVWIETGDLFVQPFNGQQYLISNFIATYGGQTIDLKIQYEASECATYIDDLEVGRETITSRPVPDTNKTYFIGAYGNSNGLIPVPNAYFSGKIHSFFIGDNEWLLKDGSGAIAVSEVGDYEAGIYTNHAGGINYINDTMWDSAVTTPYKEVLSGVGISPNIVKTPYFRQHGYQLNFALATGGNINYNGIDYPQTGLILSFEAEGLTWLFGESIGTSIESETGEFATISINESLNHLDAEVWGKKSFALVGNGSTDKIVFPNLSEIILTAIPLVGGFIHEGDTFNLTEGLGNEVFSDDGLVVGTIETLHAQGNEYINYGVWQKEDGLGGWMPYEQDGLGSNG